MKPKYHIDNLTEDHWIHIENEKQWEQVLKFIRTKEEYSGYSKTNIACFPTYKGNFCTTNLEFAKRTHPTLEIKLKDFIKDNSQDFLKLEDLIEGEVYVLQFLTNNGIEKQYTWIVEKGKNRFEFKDSICYFSIEINKPYFTETVNFTSSALQEGYRITKATTEQKIWLSKNKISYELKQGFISFEEANKDKNDFKVGDTVRVKDTKHTRAYNEKTIGSTFILHDSCFPEGMNLERWKEKDIPFPVNIDEWFMGYKFSDLELVQSNNNNLNNQSNVNEKQNNGNSSINYDLQGTDYTVQGRGSKRGIRVNYSREQIRFGSADSYHKKGFSFSY